MIFDVLTSSPTEEGQLQFDASSAVLQVAVGSPGAGVVFLNSAGNPYIEPGDNLLLKSISPYIAFGFGQGVGTHKLYLFWMNDDDDLSPIEELGGDSSVTIPNLCDGLELPGEGLFLRAPRDEGRLRLVVKDVSLNISMLGLPSALDGDTFEVQYHLRVGHTLPTFGGT